LDSLDEVVIVVSRASSVIAFSLALAIGCGARARHLGEDTHVTTVSGATVLAPKGWWLAQRKGTLELEDPDRALAATLLETPDADAMTAIDAAWQRIRPGFALKVQQAPQRPPPTRGWEAVAKVAYKTRSAERRTVSALARRFGGITYVALIEGDSAAVSRRWAELNTALWSLQPPRMHEESFHGRPVRPLDEAGAKVLDAFLAASLARLEVPGAAVAVIVNGKVVYERALGVRVLGKPDPVTVNTLFMMGSITKPMTTMMEAALVDDGSFKWDTPVKQVLPWFALGEPDITRKLTMWHTACACTGMPQQDLEGIFEFDQVTAEQRLVAMRTMKPTTGFGETFQYSNLMVAAGGYAAAHAYAPRLSLAAAYDVAMRTKMFEPAGMKSTTLDFPAAAARADHAMPHALAIDGVARTIPLAMERSVLSIGPAGAAWSNLRDMERFAMIEMAKGVTPDGNRVVSEANLLERRKQRVRSGNERGYGLGLDVGTFHGLPMVGHNGGLFGFGTMMFILPEQEIAIIVLTNIRNGGDYELLPFNAAVRRKVIEQLFAGAQDVAGTMVEFFARARREAAGKMTANLDRAPDAGWVRDLAGSYDNPSLGNVRISAAAPGGTFDVGEWQSVFGRAREEDGTEKLVFVDPPFAGGEVIVAGEDRRRTLTIQYGQMKYVFARSTK
jgi:CubicO group peptidase (beta-lactamase class C family)